jgi:hypothetical protein
MLHSIPFMLDFRGRHYAGHLQVTDTVSSMPKSFFVFIDKYVIGHLLFQYDEWLFKPNTTHQAQTQLTEEERKLIAEYLGNIAVIDYQ